MKYTTFILLFLQVFLGYSSPEREIPTKLQITNDSLQYREKVYLHVDKSYYNAGEDIWFKVYLLNAATHLRDSIRNVVYVDIVGPDNKIKDFKIIKIEEGVGPGDFALSSDLEGGVYSLRAYTNYMRNFDEAYFFRKQIYISPLNFIREGSNTTGNYMDVVEAEIGTEGQKPDLQFFPEGGQLVNGYFNRVGFKALGTDGKGIDVSGVIIDETGTQIIEFSSANLGMGIFDIRPEPGTKYKANIVYNDTSYSYDLPKGVDEGVLMRVQELRDYYQVNIQSSAQSGLNGYSLLGAQRNGILYKAKIEKDKALAVFKIDKKLLSVGIAQFTLLDDKGNALCERIAFYDNDNTSPQIRISPNSESYTQNTTVQLNIELDPSGAPSPINGANMSMAITDLAVSAPREYQSDIRTHLLLNSELKGEIEHPGYYFYSTDPKRKQHLDLLMMTQGWRQFIINDEPKMQGDGFEFIKEIGITVKGEVRKFYNPEKPDVATVKLTFQDSDLLGRLDVKSADDGSFKFLGLDIKEGNRLSFEMKDYQRPMKEFSIQLDSIRPAPIYAAKKEINLGGTNYFDQFMDNPTDRQYFDTLFENEMMKLIQLDEVMVLTEGRSKQLNMDTKRSMRSIYSSVSQTIDFTEIKNQSYRDIFALLRGRVPGLDIYGTEIVMRGRNSLTSETTPLFLLNGVPVNQEAIENVPVLEVDFIDVLKGSKAAIFGSEGGNGVIAVYTLTGKELTNNTNNGAGNVFEHQGFYQPRKFYEPAYGNDSLNASVKKFGTTIYWQPMLELDKNGTAKINFPAGTRPGSYKAILQGITADGVPIATETVFEVD
jgi:hypothetical protein